mmetsp:Transcript_9755/g.17773  ORF Transcript_9755/g.17773 Transcript_9755/m.17773 type:complete len:89 (-) Transcript_9755:579-845(-)
MYMTRPERLSIKRHFSNIGGKASAIEIPRMPTTLIPRGEKKKLEGILLSVMLLVLQDIFLMVPIVGILLPYISYRCSRKELPRSSSSK